MRNHHEEDHMYSDIIMKRVICNEKSSGRGPYVMRNHHEEDLMYSQIIKKKKGSVGCRRCVASYPFLSRRISHG